eukprot:1957940-Pleurochrysis_carterae.AAC.4
MTKASDDGWCNLMAHAACWRLMRDDVRRARANCDDEQNSDMLFWYATTLPLTKLKSRQVLGHASHRLPHSSLDECFANDSIATIGIADSEVSVCKNVLQHRLMLTTKCHEACRLQRVSSPTRTPCIDRDVPRVSQRVSVVTCGRLCLKTKDSRHLISKTNVPSRVSHASSTLMWTR